MHRVIGLLVITQRAQAGYHNILQIRLPRVDHVVHQLATTEFRPARRLRLVGADKDRVTVKLSPWPIIEIFAEQAELPKLVGDVLADIGNRVVGTNDDLAVVGILIGLRLECAGRHHPAAFVLPLGFQINRLAFFQLREGGFPESQVQDLAFARQHIVFNAQPGHGL